MSPLHPRLVIAGLLRCFFAAFCLLWLAPPRFILSPLALSLALVILLAALVAPALAYALSPEPPEEEAGERQGDRLGAC